ncbi:MAG: DNA mismatch repair protein [Campylobacterales bacterium]
MVREGRIPDQEYLNRFLNDKKRLLTEIYFEVEEYLSRFYPNVVVLMEVGSFFELYQYETRGRAKEIATLLNIQLTKKNKTLPQVDIKNPLMAGFPTGALDRYLERLVDENRYTIVLIRQKGVPPNIKRYIGEIISPGVNPDYSKTPENYLTALTIEKGKGYWVGYGAVDLNTGKCLVYEGYSPKEDPTFALDELFRLLSTYSGNEVILTLRGEANWDEVVTYLELGDKMLVRNEGSLPITYQNELFQRVFNIRSLMTPIEYLSLERFPLATETLAFLIEYAIAHNKEVVQKLDYPQLLEDSRFVYLGNNPVKQLEIGKLLRLIDFTKTPIGKRLLKERLFNPIKNREELERRWEKIGEVQKRGLEKYQKELEKIYDLEKLDRRIKVKRLHPFELEFLYSSLEGIKGLKGLQQEEVREVQSYIEYLESHFNLSKLSSRLDQIRENFLKKGVDPTVDQLQQQLEYYLGELEKLRKGVEGLGDLKVELNRNEKEGYYLSMTKNRFRGIREKFLQTFLEIDREKVFLRDLKVKQLTSSVKISGGKIEELSDKILATEVKLLGAVREKYLQLLGEMEKRFQLLPQWAFEVGEIDLALAGAKSAEKYNWSRPKISEKRLYLADLRHPLVEINQQNGIYVPNTLDFNQYQGILLYGINSSGKSSLMKSVGIALFLAQSGFYVPATQMEFTPYDSLFTRIEASDNLMKGLSTFAVEMAELKNILSRAGGNSMVLGDEIAHGTETTSAVAIVAGAIVKLAKKGANFLFATHLHQLVELEEIRSLEGVVSKHLHVYYDGEKLVYDRKLRDGSGSTLYGLEFARSIGMDPEFLQIAQQIRMKLTEEEEELQLLVQKRRSRYNKELYITTCAICGKPVEEVHHIRHRKEEKGGFIGSVPVHHRYNLIPLCREHHLKVHRGEIIIRGFITTDKGIELHYDEVTPSPQESQKGEGETLHRKNGKRGKSQQIGSPQLELFGENDRK